MFRIDRQYLKEKKMLVLNLVIFFRFFQRLKILVYYGIVFRYRKGVLYEIYVILNERIEKNLDGQRVSLVLDGVFISGIRNLLRFFLEYGGFCYRKVGVQWEGSKCWDEVWG